MTPATPPVFPGFTAEQTPAINRVSRMLQVLAPLMILAGLARLALGAVTIWRGNWGGLLTLPEGLLLAFAGLTYIAGSTDAGFLRDVKGREKEHLNNTHRSVNHGYTALLILGCYLTFIHLIYFLIRLGS